MNKTIWRDKGLGFDTVAFKVVCEYAPNMDTAIIVIQHFLLKGYPIWTISTGLNDYNFFTF